MHPRKGQETNFERLFLSGKKIHTIRGNFSRWEKIISQVQNGEAVLSIRQWAGKPYRSKQVELAQLTDESSIGIQKVIFSRSEWEENDRKQFWYWATVDGKGINIEDIASNDGFSDFIDFIEWFDTEIEKKNPDKEGWRHLELAVIHFTKLRYSHMITSNSSIRTMRGTHLN